MPRPFRLRVQDALTAALEAIEPTNGSVASMEGRVFRGRATFGDDDPLPMISILEPPAPKDFTRSEENETGWGEWDLLIQGFVKDDPVNPSDPAHFLLADTKAALIAEAQRLAPNRRTPDILGMGGRITEMKIRGGVVRPPDDGVSAHAYFWLVVTLQMVEDYRNPFA